MPITITYPIPDEPYVNSWDAGKTLTTTYNGPTDVTLYANQDGSVFATSFDMDSDAAHAFNSDPVAGVGAPTLNIRLDATSGNKHAAACWILRHFHSQDSENAESMNMAHEEVYEEATLAADNSVTYQRVTNPNLHQVYELFVSKDVDSNGDKFDNIQFRQKTRSLESHNAFLARQRLHNFRHYYETYDLGPAGESDAASYITRLNTYIAGEEGKWPWAYTTHPSKTEVPKVPLSVATVITTVKQNELLDNSAGALNQYPGNSPYELPTPANSEEAFKDFN